MQRFLASVNPVGIAPSASALKEEQDSARWRVAGAASECLQVTFATQMFPCLVGESQNRLSSLGSRACIQIIGEF